MPCRAASVNLGTKFLQYSIPVWLQHTGTLVCFHGHWQELLKEVNTILCIKCRNQNGIMWFHWIPKGKIWPLVVFWLQGKEDGMGVHAYVHLSTCVCVCVCVCTCVCVCDRSSSALLYLENCLLLIYLWKITSDIVITVPVSVCSSSAMFLFVWMMI